MRHSGIRLKERRFGSIQGTARSPLAGPSLAARASRKAALLFAALLMLGCSVSQRPVESTARLLGTHSKVGNGMVSSYSEVGKDGIPNAIGIVFQARALQGLPAEYSGGHECYDQSNDGQLDLEGECFATHEWTIPLPGDIARRSDVPFKWVGLNWNPQGHTPRGVYDLPHFDVHFYLEPIERIFSIQPGPCGPEYVRCDQFKLGTNSLPSNYMHADFKNVNAVVPAMGNHLVDQTAPEFRGDRFTQAWIYGVYDGRVTFFEQMVTQAYLLSRPAECFPIKSPPSVGVRGFYPTRYCIRYLAPTDEYTVSMENFVLRDAGAPATPVDELRRTAK